MSLDTLRNFFLWCAVINYGMLVIWLLLYMTPHKWIFRIWGRWFHLTVEQFDAANYAGIVIYKAGILLFNLIPYLALRMVG